MPRVFISSTIYDFKDLRSSLKYWLNENGFDVQLSEQSDFEKNSAKNTYEACFEAISQCDYFILLVGTRVGGLYDKKEKISITRKEYREAYRLAQEGKIKKIITFVRQNVWDVLEDRKSLLKLFREAYNLEYNDTIENCKSKILNDGSKHIRSFIDEIQRKEDIKKGIKPIFNWINIVNEFTDIIDVLKGELNINISISDKIIKHSIQNAVLRNLRCISTNEFESVIYFYRYFSKIHNKILLYYKNMKTVVDTLEFNKEEIEMAKYFFYFGIWELIV